MTPSRQDFDPESGSESIGALLTRVRLASGRSQLRVAELLCAASGVPTLTRHEVSRWERQERIPSPRWLRWLSVVLDIPFDDLERAAGVARVRRGDLPADLPADLVTPDPPIPDLPGVAAGPEKADPGLDGADILPDGAGLASRIATLRRMDDLVGGVDLTGLTGRELTAAIRLLRADGLTDRQRRRLLPAVAELAQLTCWVAADAGSPGPARRAYLVGVKAAAAAGAYPLLGHLLATSAHLDASTLPAAAGTPRPPAAARIPRAPAARTPAPRATRGQRWNWRARGTGWPVRPRRPRPGHCYCTAWRSPRRGPGSVGPASRLSPEPNGPSNGATPNATRPGCTGSTTPS
jgi:transcriptional regulator with XRE-family HTH domain